MNSHLEAFVAEAKVIAQRAGLEWEVELGSDGRALAGKGWNLSVASGAAPPPVHWLNDFGTDARAIQVLNSDPPPGPIRTFVKQPLTRNWQDLIKASSVDQLLVRRNTCGHVVGSVARPLRVLATCARDKEPWAITVDEVNVAIGVARQIQASGKLADLIFGVVRSILDRYHLTDAGPLFPALERDKRVHVRTSKFAKSLDEIRGKLEERKHAEKLPERRAFWELTRIVFTEKPRSFLDMLRFAQARTLILTGIRDGESVLLPADWKRFREHVDVDENPAGLSGGVSRSLMLRHFAEKQRIVYEDSNALYETTQDVSALFQEPLTETLDRIVAVTKPLRETLRAQVNAGRVLPQFDPSQLVRVSELYTYLTGNPFFIRMSDEDRQRYILRYQSSYDPSVFEDIRQDQLEALQLRCSLDPTVYTFLRRFKGPPYRDMTGKVWTNSRNLWSEMYLRVGEVEDLLAVDLPTKRSDTTALKLANGELPPWELMFLMPKRALSEGRNAGLCDVTRYIAVGRMDPNMISNTLSRGDPQTLFSKYGETDEDRQLTILPHSLRHLQNTELFRLGVADTIITKRFNRRRVTQSYDYDHRSLAEDLDKINLKPELESRLGEKSATVARLIKAGKVTGPIVKAFREIQKNEGEDAALDYLRAEADGFHSTLYGHCINSFMVDPCPTHVECFNGCRHLTSSGLTENHDNLVQLETRFQIAVDAIQARKQSIAGGTTLNLPATTQGQPGSMQVSTASIQKRITSIGLDNQLTHAMTRLTNVRKLLASEPGQVVFPDGPDLSKGSRKGTVLDDIL